MQKTDSKLHYDFISKMKQMMTISSMSMITLKKNITYVRYIQEKTKN